MLLYFTPSLRVATLSLSFLSCITTSEAAPLMNKTEFIDWFDIVTADSPYMKGESIAKHLYARAPLDRILTYPVDTGTGEETLSNVFTIQPDSVPGGCSSTQEAELQNAWIAAYILLPYAQAAVDNYETDAVARFIFSRLYGIIWGQQQADQTWPPANSGMSGNLADLEAIGEEILAFMEGKGLPTGINGRNSYPGPDQRFMFCSTEWMKFHNWADQARDENGVLMTGTGGEPIAIGQLREMGRWETTLWTDSFGQQVQLYPYWSSVHKDYVLNELFPGTPSSFCNRAGALGLNYDKSLPFSLTFCPATFQLNPATIARATPLQNLFPTPGSVMLHELVHFTQAGRNTPDTCYGAVGCMAMISTQGNTGRMKAITNPDTFALLATAYMYSVMDFDGTSGQGNSHLYYDLSQGFARAFRVTS